MYTAYHGRKALNFHCFSMVRCGFGQPTFSKLVLWQVLADVASILVQMSQSSQSSFESSEALEGVAAQHGWLGYLEARYEPES
jgi:hypothetical protein